MSAMDAMKDPLTEIMGKFGCLDWKIDNGDIAMRPDWVLSARIACGSNDSQVAIFADKEFMGVILLDYAGMPPPYSDLDYTEAIKEVANIIGGQCYEILRGGRKPLVLGPPIMLSPADSATVWNQSQTFERFVLTSKDGQQRGGILLNFPGEWVSEWSAQSES